MAYFVTLRRRGLLDLGSIAYQMFVAMPSASKFSSSSARCLGKMKAWQIYGYGDKGELTLNTAARVASIESPNDLLVRIHAASINPVDLRMMGGYGHALINVLRKRKGIIQVGTEFPLTLGRDFSGTVVEVGKGVNKFKMGDEVWGAIAAERQGTHAEYAVCSQNEISLKPSNLSHLDAASIPYVAATVWAALCTFGQLREQDTPGKRILILGGSGGVGTFCIQMLKAWGADVTVTCSGDALDLVDKLGADKAVDYKRNDVWQALDRLPKFDLILDSIGGESIEKSLSLLSSWKGSKLVTLVSPLLRNSDTHGVIPGLFKSAITAGLQTLQGAKSGHGVRWGVFQPNGRAMSRVARMVEQGKIVPVVQESHPFQNTPDAFQTVSDGHLRGKIIINMMADT